MPPSPVPGKTRHHEGGLTDELVPMEVDGHEEKEASSSAASSAAGCPSPATGVTTSSPQSVERGHSVEMDMIGIEPSIGVSAGGASSAAGEEAGGASSSRHSNGRRSPHSAHTQADPPTHAAMVVGATSANIAPAACSTSVSPSSLSAGSSSFDRTAGWFGLCEILLKKGPKYTGTVLAEKLATCARDNTPMSSSLLPYFLKHFFLKAQGCQLGNICVSDWCLHILCGGESPTTFLRALRTRLTAQLPPGPAKCAHVLQEGDFAYACRTCQLGPTSVICTACFRNGHHEGHDYVIQTSGGGTCDCGDSAWKASGMCTAHRTNQLAEAAALAQLHQREQAEAADRTDEYLTRLAFEYRVRVLFASMVSYICASIGALAPFAAHHRRFTSVLKVLSWTNKLCKATAVGARMGDMTRALGDALCAPFDPHVSTALFDPHVLRQMLAAHSPNSAAPADSTGGAGTPRVTRIHFLLQYCCEPLPQFAPTRLDRHLSELCYSLLAHDAFKLALIFALLGSPPGGPHLPTRSLYRRLVISQCRLPSIVFAALLTQTQASDLIRQQGAVEGMLTHLRDVLSLATQMQSVSGEAARAPSVQPQRRSANPWSAGAHLAEMSGPFAGPASPRHRALAPSPPPTANQLRVEALSPTRVEDARRDRQQSPPPLSTSPVPDRAPHPPPPPPVPSAGHDLNRSVSPVLSPRSPESPHSPSQPPPISPFVLPRTLSGGTPSRPAVDGASLALYGPPLPERWQPAALTSQPPLGTARSAADAGDSTVWCYNRQHSLSYVLSAAPYAYRVRHFNALVRPTQGRLAPSIERLVRLQEREYHLPLKSLPLDASSPLISNHVFLQLKNDLMTLMSHVDVCRASLFTPSAVRTFLAIVAMGEGMHPQTRKTGAHVAFEQPEQEMKNYFYLEIVMHRILEKWMAGHMEQPKEDDGQHLPPAGIASVVADSPHSSVAPRDLALSESAGAFGFPPSVSSPSVPLRSPYHLQQRLLQLQHHQQLHHLPHIPPVDPALLRQAETAVRQLKDTPQHGGVVTRVANHVLTPMPVARTIAASLPSPALPPSAAALSDLFSVARPLAAAHQCSRCSSCPRRDLSPSHWRDLQSVFQSFGTHLVFEFVAQQLPITEPALVTRGSDGALDLQQIACRVLQTSVSLHRPMHRMLARLLAQCAADFPCTDRPADQWVDAFLRFQPEPTQTPASSSAAAAAAAGGGTFPSGVVPCSALSFWLCYLESPLRVAAYLSQLRTKSLWIRNGFDTITLLQKHYRNGANFWRRGFGADLTAMQIAAVEIMRHAKPTSPAPATADLVMRRMADRMDVGWWLNGLPHGDGAPSVADRLPSLSSTAFSVHELITLVEDFLRVVHAVVCDRTYFACDRVALRCCLVHLLQAYGDQMTHSQIVQLLPCEWTQDQSPQALDACLDQLAHFSPPPATPQAATANKCGVYQLKAEYRCEAIPPALYFRYTPHETVLAEERARVWRQNREAQAKKASATTAAAAGAGAGAALAAVSADVDMDGSHAFHRFSSSTRVPALPTRPSLSPLISLLHTPTLHAVLHTVLMLARRRTQVRPATPVDSPAGPSSSVGSVHPGISSFRSFLAGATPLFRPAGSLAPPLEFDSPAKASPLPDDLPLDRLVQQALQLLALALTHAPESATEAASDERPPVGFHLQPSGTHLTALIWQPDVCAASEVPTVCSSAWQPHGASRSSLEVLVSAVERLWLHGAFNEFAFEMRSLLLLAQTRIGRTAHAKVRAVSPNGVASDASDTRAADGASTVSMAEGDRLESSAARPGQVSAPAVAAPAGMADAVAPMTPPTVDPRRLARSKAKLRQRALLAQMAREQQIVAEHHGIKVDQLAHSTSKKPQPAKRKAKRAEGEHAARASAPAAAPAAAAEVSTTESAGFGSMFHHARCCLCHEGLASTSTSGDPGHSGSSSSSLSGTSGVSQVLGMVCFLTPTGLNTVHHRLQTQRLANRILRLAEDEWASGDVAHPTKPSPAGEVEEEDGSRPVAQGAHHIVNAEGYAKQPLGALATFHAATQQLYPEALRPSGMPPTARFHARKPRPAGASALAARPLPLVHARHPAASSSSAAADDLGLAVPSMARVTSAPPATNAAARPTAHASVNHRMSDTAADARRPPPHQLEPPTLHAFSPLHPPAAAAASSSLAAVSSPSPPVVGASSVSVGVSPARLVAPAASVVGSELDPSSWWRHASAERTDDSKEREEKEGAEEEEEKQATRPSRIATAAGSSPTRSAWAHATAASVSRAPSALLVVATPSTSVAVPRSAVLPRSSISFLPPPSPASLALPPMMRSVTLDVQELLVDAHEPPEASPSPVQVSPDRSPQVSPRRTDDRQAMVGPTADAAIAGHRAASSPGPDASMLLAPSLDHLPSADDHQLVRVSFDTLSSRVELSRRRRANLRRAARGQMEEGDGPLASAGRAATGGTLSPPTMTPQTSGNDADQSHQVAPERGDITMRSRDPSPAAAGGGAAVGPDGALDRDGSVVFRSHLPVASPAGAPQHITFDWAHSLGLHLQPCHDHYLHIGCLETYLASKYGRAHTANGWRQGAPFLCPACRRLSNVIIPIGLEPEVRRDTHEPTPDGHQMEEDEAAATPSRPLATHSPAAGVSTAALSRVPPELHLPVAHVPSVSAGVDPAGARVWSRVNAWLGWIQSHGDPSASPRPAAAALSVLSRISHLQPASSFSSFRPPSVAFLGVIKHFIHIVTYMLRGHQLPNTQLAPPPANILQLLLPQTMHQPQPMRIAPLGDTRTGPMANLAERARDNGNGANQAMHERSVAPAAAATAASMATGNAGVIVSLHSGAGAPLAEIAPPPPGAAGMEARIDTLFRRLAADFARRPATDHAAAAAAIAAHQLPMNLNMPPTFSLAALDAPTGASLGGSAAATPLTSSSLLAYMRIFLCILGNTCSVWEVSMREAKASGPTPARSSLSSSASSHSSGGLVDGFLSSLSVVVSGSRDVAQSMSDFYRALPRHLAHRQHKVFAQVIMLYRLTRCEWLRVSANPPPQVAPQEPAVVDSFEDMLFLWQLVIGTSEEPAAPTRASTSVPPPVWMMRAQTTPPMSTAAAAAAALGTQSNAGHLAQAASVAPPAVGAGPAGVSHSPSTLPLLSRNLFSVLVQCTPILLRLASARTADVPPSPPTSVTPSAAEFNPESLSVHVESILRVLYLAVIAQSIAYLTSLGITREQAAAASQWLNVGEAAAEGGVASAQAIDVDLALPLHERVQSILKRKSAAHSPGRLSPPLKQVRFERGTTVPLGESMSDGSDNEIMPPTTPRRATSPSMGDEQVTPPSRTHGDAELAGTSTTTSGLVLRVEDESGRPLPLRPAGHATSDGVHTRLTGGRIGAERSHAQVWSQVTRKWPRAAAPTDSSSSSASASASSRVLLLSTACMGDVHDLPALVLFTRAVRLRLVDLTAPFDLHCQQQREEQRRANRQLTPNSPQASWLQLAVALPADELHRSIDTLCSPFLRQTALFLSSIFPSADATRRIDFESIFPALTAAGPDAKAATAMGGLAIDEQLQRLLYRWYQGLFLPVWAKRAMAAGVNQGRTWTTETPTAAATAATAAPTEDDMMVDGDQTAAPAKANATVASSTSIARSSTPPMGEHTDCPSVVGGPSSPGGVDSSSSLAPPAPVIVSGRLPFSPPLAPFPCISGDVGSAFSLCPLPRDFHSFLQSSELRSCAHCRQQKFGLHNTQGVHHLALCLLCGASVCMTTKSPQLTGGHSSCYVSHLLKCDGRVGLYLLWKRGGEVLCLLHSAGGTAACFWPSFYLDQYGESDHTLQRGRPLQLHAGRLRALTDSYASMAIQDYITSRSVHVQGGGGGGLGPGPGPLPTATAARIDANPITQQILNATAGALNGAIRGTPMARQMPL